MPTKLSHLCLEISLSEVQEQMHSGLCVAHEGVKKHWQRKEEARKERNLSLVQRSSEHHLPPELTYEAVFHKVCLNRLPSVALILHELLQLFYPPWFIPTRPYWLLVFHVFRH